MTSTLTAATLTTTITESISLNGSDQGATNTFTVASIVEVDKRIVNVPTSEVTILAMGTALASGQFDEDDVEYLRITNKDDTNHVTLTFKNENSDEMCTKLDAGQSYLYGTDNSGGVKDTMDADSSAISVSLGDLVDITALADTAAVDLEIFVAST